MTKEEDRYGSVCTTLPDDRRERIEQTNEQADSYITLCGQHRWDCDDYLARSFGSVYKEARSYYCHEGVPVRLDWCDHGHTTHYFLGGYHVGSLPSGQVSPRAYLESIWSAGQHIAYHLVSRQEDGQ